MKNDIQIIRENLNLSQAKFAKLLNIPVKTIRNWEQGQRLIKSYLLTHIINSALTITNEKYLLNSEINNILSFVTIKSKVAKIAAKYDIDKVYLYGSYVKGVATFESDVDLFMISNLQGFDYFGFIEEVRFSLNKKIDVLSQNTINSPSPIATEIAKTGVLIYERSKIH